MEKRWNKESGWEECTDENGFIYFQTRHRIKHRRHRFLQAADHDLLSSHFHQDPTLWTCKIISKDAHWSRELCSGRKIWRGKISTSVCTETLDGSELRDVKILNSIQYSIMCNNFDSWPRSFLPDVQFTSSLKSNYITEMPKMQIFMLDSKTSKVKTTKYSGLTFQGYISLPCTFGICQMQPPRIDTERY